MLAAHWLYHHKSQISMHRFYLPPACCIDTELTLEGREAHHALHVLRLQRGDSISVLDGTGHEFFCTVKETARHAMSLAVTGKKTTPAPPVAVTLFVGVPKGKIIEGIIQKAVELGAHRVVPLLTERVVMQLDDEGAEGKRDKWQQVAIEAIKQCGAAWLPRIEGPVTLTELLGPRLEPPTFDLSLTGSLQAERRHPRAVLREFQQARGRSPQTVGLWIGPEGDFSADELQAIAATGAAPISLGKLVLRVETAAIYCLAFLNYELQDD